MFDPNSDRLTLAWFSYLGLKRTVLGQPYERFLGQTLAPGATIFVAECRHTWATTAVGDRHVSQLASSVVAASNRDSPPPGPTDNVAPSPGHPGPTRGATPGIIRAGAPPGPSPRRQS